jgi:hypothetical protein
MCTRGVRERAGIVRYSDSASVRHARQANEDVGLGEDGIIVVNDNTYIASSELQLRIARFWSFCGDLTGN